MLRSALRRATASAAVTLGAVALTACSSSDTPSDDATGDATVEVAGESTTYPLTLESPFGETVLEEQPERVAVVSAVDLDIALSLGVVPVITPQYGDYPLEEWSQDALTGLGGELTTYDSSDGVDYEAIAAATPDVILATSGWTLDEDFDQLSKIAPIVSYVGDDGLGSMTWAERTEVAGAALGLADEAATVVADVDAAFADAAAAHPEFAGKTFTYGVIHPGQISYISHADSDVRFFTDLGFVLPERASEFTETDSAVSRENLDLLDSDVLLMGYPFGDEGLLTQSDLESDALFQQVPAVADGRYAVIDDAIASPLAYPTPLSEPWVLERLVPVLADAVAAEATA